MDTPDRETFEEFLRAALTWDPEPLTLCRCCTIMPTRMVPDHEAAGCPGTSPHYETVRRSLAEFVRGEE